MKCGQCKYWGDGDGTGISYDAGHMNYCKHIGVDGYQHPSNGACGDPRTMLYSGNADQKQEIMTRINFGCVLFEPIYVKVIK